MPTPFLTLKELEAGLGEALQSPSDLGIVEHIVCRPEPGERRVLNEANLDPSLGLVGDNWKARGSRHTADGSAHPNMQLTAMNSRVIALIAQSKDRWALAGDQLYIDLDLSMKNAPPGTRLAIGDAVLEVCDLPHTGCKKFVDRFGRDAMTFVSTPEAKSLQLRGINTKVLRGGTVKVGDSVKPITEISIKRAEYGDEEVLATLNHVVHSIHANQVPEVFKHISTSESKPWFKEQLADERSAIWISRAGDHPVGYLLAYEHHRPENVFAFGRRWLEIDQIAIDPRWTRRGLARALVETACEYGRHTGYSHVELQTWAFNSIAQETFTKLGFSPRTLQFERPLT